MFLILGENSILKKHFQKMVSRIYLVYRQEFKFFFLNCIEVKSGQIASKRLTNIILLLLRSHFNRVRLCATPCTAAHQAPLSLGFSRQEYWSGLPFPSPHYLEALVLKMILMFL